MPLFLKLPIDQETQEGCGCPKFLAGRVFWQISTLLENYSAIFRQRKMLSLPRFGHFPAKENSCWKVGPAFGNAPGFSPLRPPQPSWVFLELQRIRAKGPLRSGKRPINEGKRPIKVNGLFSGTPAMLENGPSTRPIKRSMKGLQDGGLFAHRRPDGPKENARPLRVAKGQSQIHCRKETKQAREPTARPAESPSKENSKAITRKGPQFKWGGFQEGGFSNSWTCCVFFVGKSVIARELLLKIDTTLAIATTGLRTNLLFEIPPLPKPPHLIFPNFGPAQQMTNSVEKS